QAIAPAFELLVSKLNDHQRTQTEFLSLARERAASLINDTQVKQDLRREMQRSLPTEIVEKTINNEQFWDYFCVEIPNFMAVAEESLAGNTTASSFLMY